LKHYATYPGDAWIDTAWTFTKGDPRIRIGVIDGGFDYRHPDLGGGIGPNHRVRGAWNYMSPNAGSVTWSPWNLTEIQHGTRALSTIGAISNNSIGVAGICGGDDTLTTGASMYCLAANTSASVSNAVWEASANTGHLPTSGGSGQLWMCDILSFSISTSGKYAVDTLGYGLKDEVVRAVMAFRYQNGRGTFAAMGNDEQEHRILDSDVTFTGSPQDVDREWIIAVGGTEFDELKNNYDYGMNLDILAPVAMWQCSVYGDAASPKYMYFPFSATSLATPVAAGIGGLLLSFHKLLTDPVSTRGDSIPAILLPEDIEWLLKHCAVQHQDSSRNTCKTGWGAVRGLQTLEKLKYPFILKHDSVRYSSEYAPHYEEDTLKIVFPGWTRDTTFQPYQGNDDTYRVKRYRLSKQISIDKPRLGLTGSVIERVWGRGGNGITGFGNPYKLKKLRYRVPLYRVGYCAVVGDTAYDQNVCEFETYVYKVWKIDPVSGQMSADSAWIPNPPDSIFFTYTILARVETPSAEEAPDPTSFSCEIYPNPGKGAVGLLYFSDRDGRVTIRVHDVLGRETSPPLKSIAAAGKNRYSIQTDGLSPGIYFVSIQFGDRAPLVKKLAVRRMP